MAGPGNSDSSESSAELPWCETAAWAWAGAGTGMLDMDKVWQRAIDFNWEAELVRLIMEEQENMR